MASEGGKNKKMKVIGMVVFLVVGAVAGTILTVRRQKEIEINTRKAGGMKTGILAATAAVGATTATVIILCKHTDFRKICEETLSRVGVKDARDLIKANFNAAMESILVAIEKSYTLQVAAKDPMAAKAVEECNEVLHTSIEDLKRSIDQVNIFDIPKLKKNVVDLRVWLSGAVTWQETCLDAFENTTGDSKKLMWNLMETGNRLTRNSLAILDGVADLSIDIRSRVPRRVPQPQPKPISMPISVNWKADLTINPMALNNPGVSQPTNGGSLGDSKPMTGNRRMLDQSGDDLQDPVLHSNLQMVGDASNDNQIPTPETKPVMPEDDNTPYPSWADGPRRSLINADPKTIKPNVIVAPDGSGNFKTITEAVNSAPQKQTDPFIILIKAGTYNENVAIPRHTNNVVFLGEGATTTKITGNKNFIDGVSTFHTATVAVSGDGFMAKDIWFENSAGAEKHQAVALRVSADMTIFHNCVMDGYQDTLYAHSYRQFYRQCNVSGTIDFVFGDGAAVFQDCKFIVRKPMSNQACMVTAQGRKDSHGVGGLVLQGCTITAEPDFMNSVPMPKSYLGRPWKEFSRTIIMQSFIDKNIDPEGWAPWTGTFGLDTCFYSELDNKGPGADTSRRVKWKGVKRMSPRETSKYTAARFIQGDSWITATGVPYDSGMMKCRENSDAGSYVDFEGEAFSY
ncbi:hypothetical protein L2E82_06754 [Cichorium intybus]|uniref:Uncharacterized protein n=1 Tax=Cichorium intybus TaxID=13427 RepID=A0ACB9HAF5_CICIN|nr:hypothetical protein L2E82_06754 [Cichorium intybus]